MSFGVYVHTPYCIQRCLYCDFATYEQSQILPPQEYFQILKKEIRDHSTFFPQQPLDSVYFGGGTPSLVPAELIVSVLQDLANEGFPLRPNAEVTIEINPATIQPQKMEVYLKHGINRFSVGAQTFNNARLKILGREHDAEQTRQTLQLLQSYKVNYSFDLLFATPTQTVADLKQDLEEVLHFQPNHVSPYCLTIPEGHILNANRPLEEEQIEMFEVIAETLQSAGYHRYEISNFSKPGFESRHNELYWSDDEYWGIGLSAHSYKKENWGYRFWNPSAIGQYTEQIKNSTYREIKSLPQAQFESLKIHEALTDFCHISLRRDKGLSEKALIAKFGDAVSQKIQGPLQQMAEQGWLEKQTESSTWRLTNTGVTASNHVFRNLTFLQGEI